MWEFKCRVYILNILVGIIIEFLEIWLVFVIEFYIDLLWKKFCNWVGVENICYYYKKIVNNKKDLIMFVKIIWFWVLGKNF